MSPNCKYCGQPITWKYGYMKTPPGEKNYPLNPDGSAHNESCKALQEQTPPTAKPSTIEEIDLSVIHADLIAIAESIKQLTNYFLDFGHNIGRGS